MLDGVRQDRSDYVEVRAHLARVRHVYSKRQGGADHRIVGNGPQGLLEDLLCERKARPDVDAARQVGADTPERRRSVEVSPREVEAVSGLEHSLHQRLLFSALRDISSAVVPGLIAQR